MPLMWSRDIIPDKIIRLERKSIFDGEHRFVDLGSKTHRSVIASPSVVMQRVTSKDQRRRLVVAAVSHDIFNAYGGFVGENHVVIIEATNARPVLPPTKLAKLLGTYAIDRYFRCISGVTNVSAFELNQLALPDPRALLEATVSGRSMDDAVNMAFGFTPKGSARQR